MKSALVWLIYRYIMFAELRRSKPSRCQHIDIPVCKQKPSAKPSAKPSSVIYRLIQGSGTDLIVHIIVSGNGAAVLRSCGTRRRRCVNSSACVHFTNLSASFSFFLCSLELLILNFISSMKDFLIKLKNYLLVGDFSLDDGISEMEIPPLPDHHSAILSRPVPMLLYDEDVVEVEVPPKQFGEHWPNPEWLVKPDGSWLAGSVQRPAWMTHVSTWEDTDAQEIDTMSELLLESHSNSFSLAYNSTTIKYRDGVFGKWLKRAGDIKEFKENNGRSFSNVPLPTIVEDDFPDGFVPVVNNTGNPDMDSLVERLNLLRGDVGGLNRPGVVYWRENHRDEPDPLDLGDPPVPVPPAPVPPAPLRRSPRHVKPMGSVWVNGLRRSARLMKD